MKRLICIVLLVCASTPVTGFTQERRKIKISNATLSYSALPLVAAREWKLFQEQALDVEVIDALGGGRGGVGFRRSKPKADLPNAIFRLKKSPIRASPLRLLRS